VAPHKKIRGIRFVEAIPRTPSGKLLRRLFVEQEQQALMGGPATSEKNGSTVIKQEGKSERRSDRPP
jgi:hypothetical protein